MKKGQFSGAYWLRYANFTGTSGSGSGTGSAAHTLSVVSANTTMGKATFTRLFSSNDQNHSQTEEPGRGSSDIKTYPSGSMFRAQATAFAGYKFVGWKTNIDGVGNTSVNPIEFTLVKNTTLTAQFEPLNGGGNGGNGGNTSHTVNVRWDRQMGNVTANGLTPGESAGSARLTANAGDTVKLTATPGSGYHFVKWTGGPSNGKETNPEYTFQVNNNYDITAVFAADQNGGGSGGNNSQVTPVVNATGFNLKAFVKKWWWLLLIAAWVVYDSTKGGRK